MRDPGIETSKSGQPGINRETRREENTDAQRHDPEAGISWLGLERRKLVIIDASFGQEKRELGGIGGGLAGQAAKGVNLIKKVSRWKTV